MFGAFLFGTDLLKYFLKTDQVFLHLFSFSVSTTLEMFVNWSIHTESILEKRKTYDNEKKEIKMS